MVVACAEPNPQLPPPDEVLVVANRTEATLSTVSLNAATPPGRITLSGSEANGFAVLGSAAVVPLPLEDAADLVVFGGPGVVRTVGLPAGSGATGATVVDDSTAYVANPNLNSITRIDLTTGDTASLDVGAYPQGLVSTRGRVFVLNGNVAPCSGPGGLCALGPSWLTVVDPATNTLAGGTDSIPLPGPGNARYAAIGSDGLLYVMSRGTGTDSRLSVVDPVGRRELANFGGFGASPGQMASDRGERILISSLSEGLMAFNIRTRSVERGAGTGVAIPDNSGVAVDGSFRVYAIRSGGCSGAVGQVVVLDSSLAPVRTIGLGRCAEEAAVTLLLPEAQP